MRTGPPLSAALRCVGAALAGVTLALLLASPAVGQKPATRTAESAAPAEPPKGPADEYDRGTPRSSVHAYLVAARAGDFARAAEYLDLAPIPAAERAKRGPALARRLKIVLDREIWVDLEALSGSPEGDLNDGLPRRRDRVGVIRSKNGIVDVLVERVRRADGEPIWKFSSATVARIPALYAEFGFGPLGELLPPVFFESRVLEVQLWQWIGLAGLLLFAWLGSWVVTRALQAAAGPAVARTDNELDDRALEMVGPPVRLGAGALLFGALLPALGLAIPAHRFFSSCAQVAGLVAATWLVLRLVDVLGQLFAHRLAARGQWGHQSLIPLGRRTVKALIIALAVVASLDTFGFDVTALIAGLGVGGLAVALAAQKSLENLFGSITLIADRPVQVGDFCRFGDRVGTVEDIGMRSTRVRTLDRTLVTIPNAEFSTLELENFTARDKIWYHPTIGLLYDTSPDQLRWVLVEIRKMLYSHPKVDPDPARIRFVGFGASSLDLEIFAYIRATDYGQYLEIAEDLNLRVMDIVEASGTAFAFPSTTAYLGKDAGVDAEKQRAAEKTVRDWRERGELYLPGFPPEKVSELRETLDYPEPGSPGSRRQRETPRVGGDE